MELHSSPDRRGEENALLREALSTLEQIAANPHVVLLFGDEVYHFNWNSAARGKETVSAKILRLDILDNGDQLVCAIRYDASVCTYGIFGLQSDQFYELSTTELVRTYAHDPSVLIKIQNTFSNILGEYETIQKLKKNAS